MALMLTRDGAGDPGSGRTKRVQAKSLVIGARRDLFLGFKVCSPFVY